LAVFLLFTSLATLSARADSAVTNCTHSAFFAAINTSGTITFTNDCSMALTNTIVIGGNLTIDAAGHHVSINGNNSFRLFTIQPGSTITFNGLTLASGQHTNGGALFINSTATVLITNCTFTANHAVGLNGFDGNDGADNQNAGGNGTSGTAGGPANGGVIYNLGNLTLRTCKFLTNGVSGGTGGNGGNGGSGSFSGGSGGNGAAGAPAFGGAIYNSSTLSLSDCTFAFNTATAGNGGSGGTGGASAIDGPGGNGGAGAPGAGAAIYSSGSLTVANSTFTLNAALGGNSAAGATIPHGSGTAGKKGGDAFGGAIFSSGSASLVNSTFFIDAVTAGNGGNGGDAPGGFTGGNGGNGGNATGGHILNSNSVSVVNCTFFGGSAQRGTNGVGGASAQNGSDGSPGQSRGGNLANGAGTFSIQSSIVASNLSGANGFGTFSDTGYNISSDTTVASAGTSLKNINPLLAPLADNTGLTATMALIPGSPAIDKVPVALGPGADQRGIPRPQGPAKDSGAYELVTVPFILIQPTTQTQAIGGSVTFTVAALGSSLAYQWEFNGSAVLGATNSSYTVANVDFPNQGNYDVVLTNGSGTLMSDVVGLRFSPGITQQPTNQNVQPGANASFNVTATGDPPLAYQWFFNSSNAIPGATATNLTVLNPDFSNAGPYSVVVSNSFGSITSALAILTVTVAPIITNQPLNQTVVTNTIATFSVGAVGAQPLRYQWRLNGTPIALNGTAAGYSKTAFLTNNGETFDVVITNTLGAVTSAPAKLFVVFPFTVNGRVWDGVAKGFGGITVTSFPNGSNATTDINGYYTISSLASNTYSLALSSSNCFTYTPAYGGSTNVLVKVGPTNAAGIDFFATRFPYSMTGTITQNGTNLLTPVTVKAISGGGVTNITVTANGAYSFTNLCADSYTLTPSASCFQFSPPNRVTSVGPASVSGLDFAATADLYSIGGIITDSGIGVSNITVRLLSSTNTVLSAADGTYSLAGLCPGIYTVVPTQSCRVFTPASLTVAIGPNTNGLNFTSFSDSFSKIRGRVTDGTNALSNVTVIAAGTNPSGFHATNRTDSAGNYAFSNLCSGSYVIAPSLQCVTPLSSTITIASAQTTNLADFVATQFSISGSLVGVAPGTLVTLTTVSAGVTNTSTTTNATYSVSLCAGTYSISASSPCYQFVPSSYSTTLGPSDSGRDFHATSTAGLVIRGSVTKGTNGLNGVVVNANGQTVLTDGNGNYAISNACPNSYTIIPTLPGYTFQPTLLKTNITANTTNLNFSANPALTIAPTNNGSVQLAFPALTTSRVEASTNLTNWTTLLTTDNFSTNTPVIRFTDTNASSFRARYYRVAENIAGLPQIVLLPVSNHSLPLTFIPTPITNLQIVASTNLKDWAPIFSTNYSFSNAPFQFTDPAAANFPLRYYRLSQSPGF
jgi:hypothetical protein